MGVAVGPARLFHDSLCLSDRQQSFGRFLDDPPSREDPGAACGRKSLRVRGRKDCWPLSIRDAPRSPASALTVRPAFPWGQELPNPGTTWRRSTFVLLLQAEARWAFGSAKGDSASRPPV